MTNKVIVELDLEPRLRQRKALQGRDGNEYHMKKDVNGHLMERVDNECNMVKETLTKGCENGDENRMQSEGLAIVKDCKDGNE